MITASKGNPMDVTKYNESIRTLYAQYETYLQTADRRVRGVLKKLMKEALQTNDTSLIGNIYYCYAYCALFIFGNMNDYYKNLRLASQYLMQSNRPTDMSYVYYLFAFDAINKGLYDLSYSYFLTAHRVMKQANIEPQASIAYINAGAVMLMLHEYAKARQFFRKSRSGIKKVPSHSHYHKNIVSLDLNEATTYLGEGKIDQAERLLVRATNYMNQHMTEDNVDSWVDQTILAGRIALAKGDSDGTRRMIEKLQEQIPKMPNDSMLYTELKELCNECLRHGMYDPLGGLLEKFSTCIRNNSSSLAIRELLDIKADYYLATNRLKEFHAICEEQDVLYAQIKDEQKKSFQYVTRLVQLIYDTQHEQMLLYKKNKKLLITAKADSLTKLPNRYSLDLELETAFTKAYQNHTLLGVALIDVDGLKEHNDTYGHLSGDQCLVHIGAVLSEIAKDEQIFAARYGGDEFVLIFEGKSDKEIRSIAQKLRGQSTIPFSLGVCNAVPVGKNKIWDYLSCADKAMYAAKEKRNKRTSFSGICFSKPGIPK